MSDSEQGKWLRDPGILTSSFTSAKKTVNHFLSVVVRFEGKNHHQKAHKKPLNFIQRLQMCFVISFFNRDTWNSTEVQPMRDRRSFPSAVVTEDEMYVLGGYDGNDTLRSVECYSFTTLEWTQVAPMGTPRSNAGACVFNSKIYLVGGWDGISLNSVECFDVGTRVWQRMPSLPRPTTGVRCCFLSFQSTNEQKPKSRGSRGHMCIICWWVWRYIWPPKLSWSKPFFKAVLFIIHVRS